MLPVHVQMNGYTYYIVRAHASYGVQPLGIHMTWVTSMSREGKLHRMREGGFYRDPPAYYAPPNGLMTVELTQLAMPAGFNGWRETESMILHHLEQMNHQLRQLYRAMAVAALLNRTLVMPRLQCYCFKNWFMSEQCR